MAVLHVNQENFDKLINQSALPVLVDFWAPWCGPCRMLGPILDELAAEDEGKVIIAKVNVDEEMDLAARFGVVSIPTMVFFRDGKMEERLVGVQPKEKLRVLWE